MMVHSALTKMAALNHRLVGSAQVRGVSCSHPNLAGYLRLSLAVAQGKKNTLVIKEESQKVVQSPGKGVFFDRLS